MIAGTTRTEQAGAAGVDELTEALAKVAAGVQQALGHGRSRDEYVEALAEALDAARIPYASGVWLPERYKNLTLTCGYRLDFVLDRRVVLRVETGDESATAGAAKLLRHLQLGDYPAGLVLNFGAEAVQDSIQRIDYREALPAAG